MNYKHPESDRPRDRRRHFIIKSVQILLWLALAVGFYLLIAKTR